LNLTDSDCDFFVLFCEGAGGTGFTPHVIVVESGEVIIILELG
jgi:hypothetical protein